MTGCTWSKMKCSTAVLSCQYWLFQSWVEAYSLFQSWLEAMVGEVVD